MSRIRCRSYEGMTDEAWTEIFSRRDTKELAHPYLRNPKPEFFFAAIGTFVGCAYDAAGALRSCALSI